METAYLKKCFGNSLTQALAEVARVRPSDPIEYLAHWLYHYRNVTKATEKSKHEMLWLKEEYEYSLKEAKMAEMLKQEEQQIQLKCEKCHQELLPKAVSSRKTQDLQEDTERLEEEALRQNSPPGISSVTLEAPQRALSS
ncbi:DPY30 domain-containing protein 2 [Nannospalax galili]|uniref:DPY30 domain-containing protein 2 n=1 Tax=Nannospalax galili TaxID=1026970 RepID=A0A8C6R7M6_NANGA|nr:DPY30 domain-containing protein 2 [Nannospalax galili]